MGRWVTCLYHHQVVRRSVCNNLSSSESQPQPRLCRSPRNLDCSASLAVDDKTNEQRREGTAMSQIYVLIMSHHHVVKLMSLLTLNQLTLIFSAMISGSSQTDSTKKTWTETNIYFSFFLFFLVFFWSSGEKLKKKKDLITVFFGKVENDLSAFPGCVSRIENLEPEGEKNDIELLSLPLKKQCTMYHDKEVVSDDSPPPDPAAWWSNRTRPEEQQERMLCMRKQEQKVLSQRDSRVVTLFTPPN